MNRLLTLAGTAALLAVLNVTAQDDSATVSASAALEETITSVEGKVNGLEESYLETKATIDKLAKIKVSGYVQAQYRRALQAMDAQKDTTTGKDNHVYNYNVGDFAGGKFSNNNNQQFQVRRARLKVAYAGGLSNMTLQIDVTPDGVKLKDAYVKMTEPKFKSFGIQAGFMDRPFGHEISFCDESPERSRLFQTIFKDERDLGAMLTFQNSGKLPKALEFVTLKAGAFTGNSISVENDRELDFIGRLGLKLPFEALNLAIDGGFSMYRGKMTNYTDILYSFNDSSFKWVMDSSTNNKFATLDRHHTGGDIQIYKDLPVIGGLILKGEIVSGKQPGTSITAPVVATTNTVGMYEREFMGFYAMWVQNINPINSQFVLKYDIDPNTQVEGDDVAKTSDMSYRTLGLGLNRFSKKLSGVKYTVYWDHPMNELSTNVKLNKIYNNTDLKDDVLTIRAQVKF